MNDDESQFYDLAAIYAMQALVSKEPSFSIGSDDDHEEHDPAAEIARGAYDYADAMLAERFERLAAIEAAEEGSMSLEHALHKEVQRT